jgi:hypothetical protein
VKLRVVEGPNRSSVVSVKALLIVGGFTTVMLAVAAAPVKPSVCVSVLVALFWTPVAIPVTLTLKVQLAPPASVRAAAGPAHTSRAPPAISSGVAVPRSSSRSYALNPA